MNHSVDLISLTKGEVQLARDRLQDNPHIAEFLGKWIKPSFDEPILGHNILLDLLSDEPLYEQNDLTEQRIAELEKILKHGKSKCENFRRIFQGKHATDPDITNSQILDKLAEVEAYHWLVVNEFRNIHKLPESEKSTVDFIAEYEVRTFGIEVTRLGRPQAERKTVGPIEEKEIYVEGEPLIFQEFSGVDALPKIEDALWTALENKRPQIRTYIRNNTDHSSMLIISTGHRFVLSRKLVRPDAGILPRTWGRALEDVTEEPSTFLPDVIVLLDGQRHYQYPSEF